MRIRDFDDLDTFNYEEDTSTISEPTSTALPVEFNTPPNMPLTTPSNPFAVQANQQQAALADVRQIFELAPDAKHLFDFSKTRLSPLQQTYIIAYATRGTKFRACQVAGVSHAMVDKWMKTKEFTENLQRAQDIVADNLEEELMRRAMTGSDRLLLEALKASRPQKYNPPKQEHKVNVAASVVHTWSDLAKQAVATQKTQNVQQDIIDIPKTDFTEVGEDE